ncbi:MAG TPA: KH domain-containing protein [Candidatus Saccharimonadales bacterium]
MNSIDQQFVEFIVKSLVSNPDAVSVERRIDEKGVLLELTVDPEDLGRVIGKRGATAQSLRTLLRALGTKNDARYNLKIVDNGVGSTSSAYQSDDASNDDDESDNNTVVTKTRRELAELDDLDV